MAEMLPYGLAQLLRNLCQAEELGLTLILCRLKSPNMLSLFFRTQRKY